MGGVMSRRRALASAALSALGLSVHTFAQTSSWTHAGDGTFNVLANWLGGVPTVSSTAVFAINNLYTVTFSQTQFCAAANLFAGTVTFDSGANNHALNIANNVRVSGTAAL